MEFNLDDETSKLLYQAVLGTASVLLCIPKIASMTTMIQVLDNFAARPALIQAEEELEDFMEVADALLVSTESLTSRRFELIKKAVVLAKKLGKPWVLDPDGAGATGFRNEAITALLGMRPTVIRGSAAEIKALLDPSSRSGGKYGKYEKLEFSPYQPDFDVSLQEDLLPATSLAQKHETIVAMTGEDDYVTDGSCSIRVCEPEGILSSKVLPGLGASLTSLIAASIAALPSQDRHSKGQIFASAFAVHWFKSSLAEAACSLYFEGICSRGDRLFDSATGSMIVKFLDSLADCCKGRTYEDNIHFC